MSKDVLQKATNTKIIVFWERWSHSKDLRMTLKAQSNTQKQDSLGTRARHGGTACNSNTGEMEAKGSGFQGHPQLQSEDKRWEM